MDSMISGIAESLVRIDGLTFPGLHPADNLGYTALNVLRDLLQGMPSLEQVHGVARFLHTQSNDEQFWDSWQSLHEPSLRRLEAMCFQLATDWFGCKVAPEVQEEMDRLSPAIQVWFRETSRSGFYPRSGQAKDGAWLHVLLLESLRDKADVLRETIFRVGAPPEVAQSEPSNTNPPSVKPKRPAHEHRSSRTRLPDLGRFPVSRSSREVSVLFPLGFQDLVFEIQPGQRFLVVLCQFFLLRSWDVRFLCPLQLVPARSWRQRKRRWLDHQRLGDRRDCRSDPRRTACASFRTAKSVTDLSDDGAAHFCVALDSRQPSLAHRARVFSADCSSPSGPFAFLQPSHNSRTNKTDRLDSARYFLRELRSESWADKLGGVCPVGSAR